MKNTFYKHYRLLLSELNNNKQFGLSSIYFWPFRQDDAQYLVQNALTFEGTSSEEVINCVEELLESDDNFGAYQLAPDEFYSKSINLVDQIVYNRNNLIINSWSVGLIITSAVLCLIKSDLDRWKIAYDRREARNHEASYVEYDVSPVAFSWPISWKSLLELCLNPYIGPVLGSALKEFSFIKDKNTSIQVISCLLKVHPILIIPHNSSFFKQGLINFLSLFDIDEVIASELAEEISASDDFDVLLTFLKTYKLEKEAHV